MTERQWVNGFVPGIERALRKSDKSLRVADGFKIPYSSEILSYKGDLAEVQKTTPYETDILVFEVIGLEEWKPRVVIETKLRNVTTHDAITYSQKAQAHKFVHPYLRYGILIGERNHYPLPGRLFRHGQHFDFMMSWTGEKATKTEFAAFIELLEDEVNSSRRLEEVIYNSRAADRKKYTILHKPLKLG
jgi:hypothetical protein